MSWIDDLNNQADIANPIQPRLKAPPIAQPVAAPAPQGRSGLLGKVENFGKGVVKGITQPFEELGQASYNAVTGTHQLASYGKATAAASKAADAATKQYRAGQISKTQYQQILDHSNSIFKQASEGAQNIAKTTGVKPIVGAGAQVLSYLAAPELGALKAGAPLAAKIAGNAGIGAVIGGGSAMENNENVLKGALEGGTIGGVAGGASGVLGRILARRAPAAAAAAPEAAAPVAEATPQIVSKAGPTVIDTAPKTVPVKTLETADKASTYINPQPTGDNGLPIEAPPPVSAAPAVTPTAGANQTLIQQLSDVLKNHQQTQANGTLQAQANQILSDHRALTALPPGSAAAAPTITAPGAGAALNAQTDLTNLLDEGRQKTAQALSHQPQPAAPAATDLHTPVEPAPVSPIARPSAPAATVPTEENAKALGLPAGYKADTTGSVYSPSGKELTIAEMQQLTQPKFLSDFEDASNRGDTATMEKIAAAHPGDNRVNIDYASKTPEKPGNILQSAGKRLQRAGVAVDTIASPFGARKEAELQKFMKTEGLLKAGSNPQTIYEKLPSKFDQYTKDLGKAISGDKTITKAADLKGEIAASINKENFFKGNEKATERVITNVNKAIDNAADKDGNLKSSDIYTLKQDLQSGLKAAYDKLAKGGGLSQPDAAIMNARDTVNNKLPQAARDIGHKESNLHDLAAVLKKDASKGARVPKLLGLALPHMKSRGMAHAIESTGTAVGVPLEKAGNAVANARSLAGHAIAPAANAVANGPAAPILPALAATGAVNAPPTPQGQPAAPDQSALQSGAPGNNVTDLVSAVQAQAAQQQQAPANTLGITSNDVEQLMLEDLVTTGGQNLTALNTIHTLLENSEKAAAPPTLNQTATNQINTIQRAQNGLQAIQAAFQNTRGTGEGLLSKVQASPIGNFTGGKNVQNVNAVIQASLPSIATALGMGTSTAELKALANQLPNTSDTQKSAQAKLNVISSQINQYLSQYLNNESNFVQPTNDSLSALAQLSAGGVAA